MFWTDLARNGCEVLEAVRHNQYDIVLMDVQMPEMDGLTATRELRRTFPHRPPYVVAMTANAL
jgi:CheY-like chemotaxis protein